MFAISTIISRAAWRLNFQKRSYAHFHGWMCVLWQDKYKILSVKSWNQPTPYPMKSSIENKRVPATSLGFRQHYFVCRRGRELKWSNLPVSNENWAARSFGETNVPNTESDLCRCFWTWNRSSKFHWMCPSMVKFHRLQNCSVCVSKMHNMHLTP